MKLPYRLLLGIRRHLAHSSLLLGFALLLGTGGVAIASVIDSKHNLSSSGPGPVKATSETQICVFCHTPHGGDQTAGAPLWNRQLSTATYTPYLSSSTDANQPPGPPGASSKVCLSCHDGTLAIGTVGNLNGQGASIAMSGTGTGGVMPDGTMPGTGYTRNLGIDLSNDHPISFIYDTTLASNDGELRPPPVVSGSTTVVGNRSFGVIPTFPLENSQMQCATCHDPHLSTNSSPKFLRGNRLQQAQPLGSLFAPASDITCLACHDKDKAVATWSNSAHANINVANEAYTNAAATTREFPLSTPVWQASCLGCHDTHTVPGARHLLREGTSAVSNLTSPKAGGHAAMEQTCYQCHSGLSTSVLNQSSPPNTVPDIMTDFGLAIHMPISADIETHDIGGNFDDRSSAGAGGIATDDTSPTTGLPTGRCNTSGDQCGKDFMEREVLLGKGSLGSGGSNGNRHAECTDCHNPHRATKKRLFNTDAATPDAAGTHLHNIDTSNPVAHSNIASGSLRGSFGVEPVYYSGTGSQFGTLGIPYKFIVKRGDPGFGGTTDLTKMYVTREYQICLKCHSNYAYDTPDRLSNTFGYTPDTTNGFNVYLNTAMEIQAPATDKGVLALGDSGAYSTYSANNQRSWHPIMDNTGRTVSLRGNANANLWRAPWNGSNSDSGSTLVEAVGNQTMYCSDCHGSVTTITNGVVPDGNGSVGAWTEDGKPWGPHGSAANFILKGSSDTTSPTGVGTDTLCFRCHDATQYADASGAPITVLKSGFSGVGNDAWGVPITNLHQRHAFYTSLGGQTLSGGPAPTVWPASATTPSQYRCTMCHTGTAHGWKNKDFLVNLNDVGPEVNKATNGTVGGAIGTSLGGSGEIPPAPYTPSPLPTSHAVPQGTQVPAAMAPVPTGYTNGPYYQGALLRIASTGFKASGTWTKTDCTTSGCH